MDVLGDDFDFLCRLVLVVFNSILILSDFTDFSLLVIDEEKQPQPKKI